MNPRTIALIGSTVLAAAIAWPRTSEAQTHGGFVYSATGPGISRTSINLGVRAYTPAVDQIDVVLPTADLSLVYGINDALDYELRVSTVGILTLIDTGVKVRILGNRNLALGARLDASGLLAVLPKDDGTEVSGLFGVTPGLILSTGGRRFQISAGLDLPVVLGTASDLGGVRATGPDSVFGYVLRPWVGVELPIGRTTNLSLQAQAYVSTLGDTTAVAPNLALGITF